MSSVQVPEILASIHRNLKSPPTLHQPTFLSLLDMLACQFPRNVLTCVLTHLPQNDRYQPWQPCGLAHVKGRARGCSGCQSQAKLQDIPEEQPSIPQCFPALVGRSGLQQPMPTKAAQSSHQARCPALQERPPQPLQLAQAGSPSLQKHAGQQGQGCSTACGLPGLPEPWRCG